MSMAALAFHRRSKWRSPSLPSPSFSLANHTAFVHFYSSFSSNSNNSGDGDPAGKPHSPLSSIFNDVKAKLNQQKQQQQQRAPESPQRRGPSFTPSGPPAPKAASFEEIRQNLSQFRLRSTSPPTSGPGFANSSAPPQRISFQDRYKKDADAWSGEAAGNKGNRIGFDAIRESLKHLRTTEAPVGGRVKGAMSLSETQRSFKLKPVEKEAHSVIGGSEPFPMAAFGNVGKEEVEREDVNSSKLVHPYTHEELGKKLRDLRPQGKSDNWFSLEELNERLVKLRKMEIKASKAGPIYSFFREVREDLQRGEADERKKKSTVQRLNILGQLGGTPKFMLSDPKEQLVEKYFHPDNMSSAEKMKIELQKVREEFKTSESDCGSARVQVAQLTTKIKHLSSVLHKKDKHSQKGLKEMVQRRKKLLKYLRRTDWDSYCFVLSKLGLRDTQESKA